MRSHLNKTPFANRVKFCAISFILSFSLCSVGQTGYEENTFCHNAKKELVCFSNDDYIIRFEKQLLVSFQTTDSLLFYREREKRFEIRNLFNGVSRNVVIVQLVNGKPVVKFDSTEIQVDTFRNRTLATRIPGSFEVILNLNNVLFSFIYENHELDKILFAVGSRSVSLHVDQTKGAYSWIVRAGTQLNEKSFWLSYQEGLPKNLRVQNEKTKKGVSFYPNEKHLFSEIGGVYITPQPAIVVDDFEIVYRKNGTVKRAEGFEIKQCNCE